MRGLLRPKSPNSNKNPARIYIIVAAAAPPIEGFKEGLAELSWIEERNVNFAIRVAQGQNDRLPGLDLDGRIWFSTD
jgi:hypothetical protein